MQVLILSPHPDDDVIAMGGTIAKHTHAGDTVTTIYMTSGEAGVSNDYVPSIVQLDILTRAEVEQHVLQRKQAIREREAGLASQVLHTTNLYFLRQPDGELDVILALEAARPLTLQGTPDRIYVPHVHEDHPDHYKTNHVATILRDWNEIDIPIYSYEVWTPIERPNFYVDITPYAQEKHAAIMTHESQRSSLFAEAALSLNRYRGIMSGLHYYYAEAFIVNE